MRSIRLILPALIALAASWGCSAASGDRGAALSSGSGGEGGAGAGGSGLGFGGGTAAVDGGASCVSISLQPEHRPLDLYLMLDRSGSMQGAPWAMAKQALEQFFSAPPGGSLSAALNYFPNQSVDPCVEEGFSVFAVDIGPLPGIAGQLAASLELTTPSGGTPMGDALRGALQTATARKDAMPDHQVAVVLVTDGEPNDYCHVPTADIAQLATEALLDDGTLTFAVGTGGAPVPLMDAIAAAGGTDKSLSITSPSELDQALTKAQLQAVGCEFVVPVTAPGGEPVDPGLVNVSVTDAIGTDSVPQVGGPGLCGDDAGWYYDDSGTQTLVRLCPASCDLLEAAGAPTVDINFGCKTIVK